MTKPKPGRHKQGGDQEDVGGGGILGSLTDFVGTLSGMTSAGEQRLRRARGHPEEEDGSAAEGPAAGKQFGRILDGLADIVEKLNEISEEGETLSKEGEFAFPSKKGGVKGVYGFSIRTGLSGKDDQIRVEPFGNIRKDEKTGEVGVQEISEPLIDLFEDDDSTTLIAEMPGVGQEDISIDVRDDILTIQAQKGEKKYRKEILLRHRTTNEGLAVTCNNGVVTICCPKAG